MKILLTKLVWFKYRNLVLGADTYCFFVILQEFYNQLVDELYVYDYVALRICHFTTVFKATLTLFLFIISNYNMLHSCYIYQTFILNCFFSSSK